MQREYSRKSAQKIPKGKFETSTPSKALHSARGGIIDEAALDTALENNTIGGAAIDPFVVEPATPDNPLFRHDNILVSPHSAGVTRESVFRMGASTAQNVVDCFDGKLDPANVVNKEVL